MEGFILSKRLWTEALFLCFAISCLNVRAQPLLAGSWDLSLENAGVSAMHMTLLRTNKLLIFDQTLAGPSQTSRSDSTCGSGTPPAGEDCLAHWPRVMNDMLILPTGEVLIINGAKQRTAGWQTAREPALSPFLYRPAEVIGNRFRVLAATAIPRVYHSTANVLPDGRILVGGSNSNFGYRFSGVTFPTELRLEAYNPYYLHSNYDPERTAITSISTKAIKYASKFIVRFSLPNRSSTNIRFHVYAPPFTRHTWSMNQRMLSLAATAVVKGSGGFLVGLTAPPKAVAAED